MIATPMKVMDRYDENATAWTIQDPVEVLHAHFKRGSVMALVDNEVFDKRWKANWKLLKMKITNYPYCNQWKTYGLKKVFD